MLVDEPTAPILHPPNWNSRWQRHFFTKRRGKGLVPVAPISYWQDENSNNWSPFQKMRVKTYHKIKSEYFIKFVIVFKEHLDACSWNFTTVKGMNWDVRICSLNDEASKINKQWLVDLSTQKAIDTKGDGMTIRHLYFKLGSSCFCFGVLSGTEWLPHYSGTYWYTNFH